MNYEFLLRNPTNQAYRPVSKITNLPGLIFAAPTRQRLSDSIASRLRFPGAMFPAGLFFDSGIQGVFWAQGHAAAQTSLIRYSRCDVRQIDGFLKANVVGTRSRRLSGSRRSEGVVGRRGGVSGAFALASRAFRSSIRSATFLGRRISLS